MTLKNYWRYKSVAGIHQLITEDSRAIADLVTRGKWTPELCALYVADIRKVADAFSMKHVPGEGFPAAIRDLRAFADRIEAGQRANAVAKAAA